MLRFAFLVLTGGRSMSSTAVDLGGEHPVAACAGNQSVTTEPLLRWALSGRPFRPRRSGLQHPDQGPWRSCRCCPSALDRDSTVGLFVGWTITQFWRRLRIADYKGPDWLLTIRSPNLIPCGCLNRPALAEDRTDFSRSALSRHNFIDDHHPAAYADRRRPRTRWMIPGNLPAEAVDRC